MATSHIASSVGLVQDLVQAAMQDQPVTRKKANTVTVAVGSLLTGLASGGAYWVESGIGGPSWLPLAVFFIGQAITVLATSKTTNGVTESVADRLNTELSRRIDTAHSLEGRAEEEQTYPDTVVDDLRRRAQQMLEGRDVR